MCVTESLSPFLFLLLITHLPCIKPCSWNLLPCVPFHCLAKLNGYQKHTKGSKEHFSIGKKKDKMCEFSGKSSFSQLRTTQTQTVHLSFASWMLNLLCVFDLFSECWQPALFQIIKKIEWSFLLFGNITVVFKKCWWFIPNHGLYKFVYIYIMLALQYADYQ